MVLPQQECLRSLPSFSCFSSSLAWFLERISIAQEHQRADLPEFEIAGTSAFVFDDIVVDVLEKWHLCRPFFE